MAGRSDEVRVGYLRRLGVDAAPPSVDALFRLHRAHVERVAWETLWIHLDEWWPVDRAASAARIADRGRGGYCFHLNGAFQELLIGLGYRVVGHAATVRHPGDEGMATTPDHLTLTVDDLPSDANPTGRWVVDVGLGSGLHEPIPLLPGGTQQGRLRFDLDRSDDAGSRGCSWRLARTPPSGWAAITWRDTPTALAAFDARHRWLSRSPDSHFVQLLTVQRWRGRGHDVLRGLTLTAADSTTRTIESRPELLATLDERFGISLDAVPNRSIDRLWADLVRAHEAWVAAGRP